MRGNIRVRLDRIEARMPAPEDGPSGASEKLRAVLDELASLKSSGASYYRGGVLVEGEDVPGRILGPGYTFGGLVRLAAERAADGGAFGRDEVPAAVESLRRLSGGSTDGWDEPVGGRGDT